MKVTVTWYHSGSFSQSRMEGLEDRLVETIGAWLDNPNISVGVRWADRVLSLEFDGYVKLSKLVESATEYLSDNEAVTISDGEHEHFAGDSWVMYQHYSMLADKYSSLAKTFRRMAKGK